MTGTSATVPTPRQRSMRIDHILHWCGPDESDRFTNLIDLLTDAMHWCDDTGQDFQIAFAHACRHYDNELNDQPTDQRSIAP